MGITHTMLAQFRLVGLSIRGSILKNVRETRSEIAMPTFTYAKLVRDKIPDWHRARGHSVIGRQLSLDELRVALIAKLREVAGAFRWDDLVEEIGDIQQIIDDLCVVMDITKENLATMMARKVEDRGGFLCGEYIETVTIADENDPLVQRFRHNPAKYLEVEGDE